MPGFADLLPPGSMGSVSSFPGVGAEASVAMPAAARSNLSLLIDGAGESLIGPTEYLYS